jgi:hypothetical protein
VSLAWILLGIVAWLLVLAFVLLLMRMSGDQDRAARRAQKDLFPYCEDGTITQSVG